ncbi:hypothetical protein BGY98DRAFT_679907 [Russula aff. rugulosa BPL654]|nr:hypothetical protein BGY98DRAFT_679907 [Russula aff. rugulosa BPL654]
MAIPTTILPGTHPEQQQSLPNIPTRPVGSGGTSTADHPQNPPRPSGPGIVSPGQPIANAQHKLNANEDQYGPLPEGWESGIDPLGLTYYVNHHTRSITRNRPSPDQAVDHQAPEGETSTTGSGSLPVGWEERRTPDGQLFYVDNNTLALAANTASHTLTPDWFPSLRVPPTVAISHPVPPVPDASTTPAASGSPPIQRPSTRPLNIFKVDDRHDAEVGISTSPVSQSTSPSTDYPPDGAFPPGPESPTTPSPMLMVPVHQSFQHIRVLLRSKNPYSSSVLFLCYTTTFPTHVSM